MCVFKFCSLLRHAVNNSDKKIAYTTLPSCGHRENSTNSTKCLIENWFVLLYLLIILKKFAWSI